jgi:ComF family protein
VDDSSARPPRWTIGRTLGIALTTAAQALVAATLAPLCAACRRPLDAPLAGPICGECWREARHAAGAYDGALRHIIHAYKYEGRRTLARPLAAIIQEQGADLLRDADCVVPVPLHPIRRLRRGFNQAAELARHLGVPVVHALWRIRPTAAQAGLTAAERARNVRGAFRLSPWLSPHLRRRYVRGAIVVIVDDVTTTGATLTACAEVLRAAGAREVRALTVARAPLKKGALDATAEEASTARSATAVVTGAPTRLSRRRPRPLRGRDRHPL